MPRPRPGSLALAALAAVSLVACKRDLAVPPPNTLALGPSFTAVAPREMLVFQATGGAGSYRYAFSEGGQLSGPDATIDATTGIYRAGRFGSALDVVEVTDAAGNVALARISVGERLSASPVVATTPPGGAIAFVPSGGRPPYGFDLQARSSGGTVDPATGAYQAGSVGDVLDLVVVSDSTGDPAATAIVEVHVSAAVRLYRGTAGALAPLEQVVFAGLNGQGPYTYSIPPGGNHSGGAIDAVTGIYQAGPAGSTQDRVRVTDALGEVDEDDVSIGPALALAPPAAALHPQITGRLQATGGKPPYTFAYVPLANRSGGAVEFTNGDYTPGPNGGALDEVEVFDAVGASATLRLPAVGPVALELGTGVSRCLAADLNGDARDDAVFFDYDSAGLLRDLQAVSMPAGADAVAEQGWLAPPRGKDHAVAGDFNGSGRKQLAFFGQSGLWTLVPDAAGHLGFGSSLAATTFWATPPSDGNSLRYPIAADRLTGLTRLYTSAQCTTPSPGIVRVDWPTGASAPSPTVACEPLAVTNPIQHLFATDMNGDGRTDLVWIEYDAASTIASGPVRVALGQAAGGFAAPLSFPFQVSTDRMSDPDTSAALTPGGLFLRIGYSVAFLRKGTGGASPAWATGTWPYTPNGTLSFVAGIAVRDPAADRIVAWDPYGNFVGVDAPGGVPATVTILPGTGRLPDGASCAVFPDLDGDGVPDVIATMFGTQESLVLPGDGDGGFGSRFRVALDGSAVMAGRDVTGDGVPDLVTWTGSPGLRVLAGGRHQLAYGPERGAPAPVMAIAAGNVGTGGGAGLYVVDEAGLVYTGDLAGGAVTGPSRVGDVGVLSALELALATNLGSADPRDDLFVVTRQGDAATGFSYEVGELLAGTSATRVFGPLVFGFVACAILPAGTVDVASACTTSSRNDVVIGRASRSGASLSSFTNVTTLPGTGGLRASMAAAGRLADGTAVLVVAPSAPAGSPVQVSAQLVSPSFTITSVALSGIGEPVTSAALGDVNGDGRPDLLVRAGTQLWVFPGQGGSFSATGSSVTAPGRVLGAAAIAGGTAGDVLLENAGKVLVLRNDGTGVLR